MPRCATCLLITALIVPSTRASQGQDHDRRKLAITDAAQADKDFVFQGEYSGEILGTGSHRVDHQRVGLQVVALGDAQFSAVQYRGGLPGGGWDRSDRVQLQGQRDGEILHLKNDALQVTIQNRRARIATHSGTDLGELIKVRRRSRTLGAPPPQGALVLFDGTHTKHLKNAKTTADGLLQIGTELKQSFRDYTLHLEFCLPYMPHARGQGRANSGVYLQSRYEVQILDSFGLEGKFNECGALYRYQVPDVNMCLPPLTWQTYEICFHSPRYDVCGNKICNARLTVWHNGVAVHDHFSIERKTGAGRPETPELLPTKIQDHGNPVVFRNVWLVQQHVPSRMFMAGGTLAHRPLVQPVRARRFQILSRWRRFR